jgi:hypothetical protein
MAKEKIYDKLPDSAINKVILTNDDSWNEFSHEVNSFNKDKMNKVVDIIRERACQELLRKEDKYFLVENNNSKDFIASISKVDSSISLNDIYNYCVITDIDKDVFIRVSR